MSQGIRISKLTQTDVGRWVFYQPENSVHHFGSFEIGRIKGWNYKWVFVVFHCDGNWDDFMNYTAAATSPWDLCFIGNPEIIEHLIKPCKIEHLEELAKGEHQNCRCNDFMSKYFFKLEGRRVVRCTVDEHMKFMSPDNGHLRVVGKTFIDGDVLVSTVFVGTNFSNDKIPLVFETMVFIKDDESTAVRRYPTWIDAKEGHCQMVRHIIKMKKDCKPNWSWTDE